MKNLKLPACLKRIRRILLRVTESLSRLLAAVNLVLADGDDAQQTPPDRRNAVEANDPGEKQAVEPDADVSVCATE